MKYHIDPTIDCVFKKLLGSLENKNLLIHFLNAVIKPPENKQIVNVDILNPYNDKEFLSDKLSIVDVKAKDSEGRETFQIDIQLSIHAGLKSRILFCWSDIYTSQLQKGHDFDELKPVIAIWIITETLFNRKEGFHYHFQLFDSEHKISLNDDCSIHILELTKFDEIEIKNELERWLFFFKNGVELDDEALPDYMNTNEMRQAMQTLKTFSEKEREYHLYQSRLNYVRIQRGIEKEMKCLKKEKERAEKEKERAEKEKELALQEKELALQREKEALQREKKFIDKFKAMGVNIDNI